MSDCVRGCVQPCRCDTCIPLDEPEHDPQPRPAETDAHMCRRCNDKLRGWLDTILEDTLRLDTRIPTDYGWDKQGAHQKISGSPALIRLDVAALTDPRTTWDPTDPHTPVDIPGELCSWARLFTEEHRITTPVRTMNDAVGLLQRWWDELVGEPWIDEFYTVMADIRRLLDAAHRVERPRLLGGCFTCDTPLYTNPRTGAVRCGRCGRRYDGMSLVALEVQRRREVNA